MQEVCRGPLWGCNHCSSKQCKATGLRACASGTCLWCWITVIFFLIFFILIYLIPIILWPFWLICIGELMVRHAKLPGFSGVIISSIWEITIQTWFLQIKYKVFSQTSLKLHLHLQTKQWCDCQRLFSTLNVSSLAFTLKLWRKATKTRSMPLSIFHKKSFVAINWHRMGYGVAN